MPDHLAVELRHKQMVVCLKLGEPAGGRFRD